jgi:hypothetical protein
MRGGAGIQRRDHDDEEDQCGWTFHRRDSLSECLNQRDRSSNAILELSPIWGNVEIADRKFCRQIGELPLGARQ